MSLIQDVQTLNLYALVMANAFYTAFTLVKTTLRLGRDKVLLLSRTQKILVT